MLLKLETPAVLDAQTALLDALQKNSPIAVRMALVGSLYIIGEGADLDILALVPDADDGMCLLVEAGYAATGDPSGEDDEFRTLRKGDVNVIVTDDEVFFDNFTQAAEVCKALMLREKWQRIAVHRVLMNGEDALLARVAALKAA